MVRTWALEPEEGRHHHQRGDPGGGDRDDGDRSYFAAAVEAEEKGEAMPAFFRHDLGFGTSDDVAGLIAFLASDAAASVSGQAIGIGGDRLQLWSHPEAVATAYREGAGPTTPSSRASARPSATCRRSARNSRPPRGSAALTGAMTLRRP